ncbi:hypothetical protein PM082_011863 [Marasmius tenuissimus]|nr:hypothetical protein PM082_011863 [Marasmius tenuissimus]
MDQHPSRPRPSQPPVSELALYNAVRWPGNGVRLRVVFIDKPAPPPKVQQSTVKDMNFWSLYSNVYFTLLEPSDEHIAAAEVRISFSGKGRSGCWSYDGTLALQETDQRKATMMLEGIAPGDAQALRRATLHETGHILGFAHEHCRSGLINRIDGPSARKYYCGPKENWSKATFSKNFTPLDEHLYTLSAREDKKSIMCYGIYEFILKAGMKDPAITGGNNLSWDDRLFAGHEDFYPVPKEEAMELETNRAIVGIAASEKALYLLMKNGDIKAYFEMNGRPEKHIIDKVEDPTKTTLIASDDTLYKIENEFVVSIWRGSPGDDRDDWHQVNGRSIHDVAQVDIRGNANYYLDNEGRVVMYDGNEHGGHWRTLNKSGDTLRISSTNTHLYRLERSGKIYQIPVPRRRDEKLANWERVNRSTDTITETIQIATNWRHLYQQRRNGEVWVYTGKDKSWMKIYPPRRAPKGSKIRMPEPVVRGAAGASNYSIQAQEDRFFIMFHTCSDDNPSGVWVNDSNTDHIASKVYLELDHHKGIHHVVGGWKPLQISKDWTTFVYTAGCVYVFVKRTGKVTRYTGIC